ncbi:DNA recombination protein RmuC [Halosquirtibacter xylanolyticus]|uniref:DNA recombination protein RmuC n=1 Tax=Halosquirtibacter xylanolyticus TaxID=3374599 RepID=UPI003747D7F9|nr:DNA recombination protein RmuC [Prolixibacteraceae bacterium]
MLETILLALILILLVYIIWGKKRNRTSENLDSDVRLEMEILRNENSQLKKGQQTHQEQRDQIIRLQTEKQNMTEQYQLLNDQCTHKNGELQKKEQELITLRASHQQISFEKDNLKTQVAQERESINVTKVQLEKEFQLLANKVLETNSERFAANNKASLDAILKPLRDHIDLFKGKVEEVYDKESKQRFSLEQEVKKLMELNQRISLDAQNLTHALKGESKVQGNWGEMILESILEKSGLRKGQEYFMEHVLRDSEGKKLRNDQGNSMRPDAVIVYPDQRKVIVDSKVSLNAYIRYCETDDPKQQQNELDLHVAAIKQHVISLSKKSYDDYPEALDFVMMFIPNEPAYMAAMKHELQLWQFAYDKRVLILSPTNLITALKLVSDLWKREHQNINALEIAERGGKLYDKFVGFVENLQKVEKSLNQAQGSFGDAFKQLYTGKDNLVKQAEKLKELGVKNKKQIPEKYTNDETPILP